MNTKFVTTQRVDAHTHIGLEAFLAEPIPKEMRSRPAFKDRMENLVTQLLAAMDANQIDRAVAFGFPLKEIDRLAANEYVLEAARLFPSRIIPFALVGDDTDYWLKRGMRGFKQQDILYAPERFDLFRAYQTMAEASVPMLVHFRAGPDHDVAQQVRTILNRVPALKLIVAHMGRHAPNTSQGVETALLGLREYPNVIFETSTVRDPAVITRAVEILGDERVVFGSDYPFNAHLNPDPLAVEIDVIATAALPPAAQRKVMGGNILKMLNIAE